VRSAEGMLRIEDGRITHARPLCCARSDRWWHALLIHIISSQDCQIERCVCPQAALYEKLSIAAANDDEEHYNVDFLRKGLLSDEAPGTSSGGGRGSAPIDSALDALGQGGAQLLRADQSCVPWTLHWQADTSSELHEL